MGGVRPFHHQTILVKIFAHPMMTLIMLSTTNPSNHEPVRNLYEFGNRTSAAARVTTLTLKVTLRKCRA